MTCLGPVPTADLLATIERCATEAGGPNWQEQAMLGLQVAVLLLAIVLLVGALAVRLGR